jgi:multicomponent Na+:H+ antiporter subunit F
MISFLSGAAVFVLLAIAGGMLRVLYGPAEVDRMMASQLLGTGGVALLLLMAAVTDSPSSIDVALMLALFAAFASIAFVASAPRTENEHAEPGDRE